MNIQEQDITLTNDILLNFQGILSKETFLLHSGCPDDEAPFSSLLFCEDHKCIFKLWYVPGMHYSHVVDFFTKHIYKHTDYVRSIDNSYVFPTNEQDGTLHDLLHLAQNSKEICDGKIIENLTHKKNGDIIKVLRFGPFKNDEEEEYFFFLNVLREIIIPYQRNSKGLKFQLFSYFYDESIRIIRGEEILAVITGIESYCMLTEDYYNSFK